MIVGMRRLGDGKGTNNEKARVKTGFGINSPGWDEIQGLVVRAGPRNRLNRSETMLRRCLKKRLGTDLIFPSVGGWV
jgi:hypothetical protein